MTSPTLSPLSLLLAALLAALLMACPATTPTADSCGASCEPDPLAALIAYRDLLAAKNPREAFTWLHPDATEGLDADGFALLFSRHGDALLAQADDLLARARAATPDEVARVKTAAGEVLVVKTHEGWRLSAPVGAAPPAP